MSCGVKDSSYSDGRINRIFQLYDTDENGLLTCQGFIEFYLEACRSRVDAVWNDILTHGYGHDLRKVIEVLFDIFSLSCQTFVFWLTLFK